MLRWLNNLRIWFMDLSDQRKLQIIIGAFVVAQIFIWYVLLELLWYGHSKITDIPIYYHYSRRVVSGMIPYRDFASEYPPVGLLLFILPRLYSGSNYGRYAFLFGSEMLIFSSGIVYLLAKISFRLWRDLKKTAFVLAIYLSFILALGSIVKLRFDIAVAFLILASIAAYLTDRRLLAWVLLGIGIMTKIVPVLIAPLFLAVHFRRRQWEELWMGPTAAALAALIIAIPFLLASPSGLLNSFLYHAERPLQIESTWASPLLLLASFGRLTVQIMSSFGSHNVFSSYSDTLALVSGPAAAVFLMIGYAIFLRRNSGGIADLKWQEQFLRFSAIAIATFIVSGKVFSPQFLIWLLPLVPLVAGRDRRLALGVFAGVLLLTQWEFPSHYWNLFAMDRHMIIIVAIRNLMLGFLVIALLMGGRVKDTEAEARPASGSA